MKKIAYACCLGVIGILTTEFGVIGILPQVAAYYHITINKAGLLLSAFALTVAIAGPIMSLLSSGFDRKKIILTSLSLFLIAAVVSAFSPPFWLLVTIRILPALLHSVYYAAAIAAVIRVSERKNQHKMMAIALSGISIATVSTIPLSSYLASVINWQCSFILQAILTSLALISIYIIMPSMPVSAKVNYGSQLQILKKAKLWFSLLMSMLMFTAEFSVYSFFADYLIRVKSMSATSVSYMMFVFGISGLIGTWIAGKALSKNITLTSLFFISGCNLFIPMALYFLGCANLTSVLIVILWGMLYAPGFLIATSSVSVAAPEALEFANGLTTSFANFGITAGTMISGWVISHHGISYIPWVAICSGATAAVSVIIGHYLDERKRAITAA